MHILSTQILLFNNNVVEAHSVPCTALGTWVERVEAEKSTRKSLQ